MCNCGSTSGEYGLYTFSISMYFGDNIYAQVVTNSFYLYQSTTGCSINSASGQFTITRPAPHWPIVLF